MYLAVLLLLAATSARAAPPRVDVLFPSGALRGTTTTITAHGAFEKWPVSVWCDRTDVTIKPADEKGKLSIAVPPGAPPGVAWIRHYDAEGTAAVKPFVIGLLPEIVEVEPNNEPAKAQRLESSTVTINGRLEPAGDVDVFAVPLKQGQTLVAALDAHRTLLAPMDGVLQILSPQGFLLEHNDDDHGLDPQVVFSAPADGVYLVRAMAFPAETSSAIALAGGANYVYRLTLSTGPVVDHVRPFAASSTGSIEPRTFGWNLPEPAPRLSFVAMPDQRETVAFAPPVANFLTLPNESHALAVETRPAGSSDPQEIALPVTLTGALDEPGEVDAYRVRLPKGVAVSVRVVAQTLGSPLDPVLTLSDASGKMIQRVDDAPNVRDAEIAFTAPEEAEYRLTVADLHRRGGWRYYYNLRLTRVAPEFALSVAAESFTLTPGKPLEIPVTIERLQGFAEEIEISAVGLPAHVTATPVKSLKEGESAKTVKLILTATETPWSGPLTIRGQTTGETKLSRDAHTVASGTMPRTNRLWLTVLPTPERK